MAIPRFWGEIGSRYNLYGSKCGNCGTLDFPPRTVCPDCGRRSFGKMERVKLKGNGTVVSFSFFFKQKTAYEMMKPYVVAIVEMEEGCRVTSQIVDVDPATVKIGMQVNAAFRKLGSEGEAGVIHYGDKFRPRL